MASAPNYTSTPRSSTTSISTANTARDGSGTMGTIITAGTNGTRIDALYIAATATTAAGQVGIYVSSTTGANTSADTHLLFEIPVTAVTPSTTTAAFSAARTSAANSNLFPMFLPGGFTLRASTQIANSFRVTAVGGDF